MCRRFPAWFAFGRMHEYMERLLWMLAGLYGFAGVAFGAFGAHGLRTYLARLGDGAQRAAWWETAAHYHLIHALAIGLTAYLAGRVPGSTPWIAGGCFALGVLLFSGSLYAMTLTGVRALGAITPLGGLLLLAGWGMIAWVGFRLGGAS
jgi:uncharacterized membrane protein YgdD (TMEM256/DUF423 family)